MLRVAVRALALALYTLAGAAMIVDARHEGGLPESFPALAQLREMRGRLAVLGGPAAAGLPLVDGGETVPERTPGVAAAVGPGDGALPGPRMTEPSGDPGVRVNRGLP
jgi:hypothetical protein